MAHHRNAFAIVLFHALFFQTTTSAWNYPIRSFFAPPKQRVRGLQSSNITKHAKAQNISKVSNFTTNSGGNHTALAKNDTSPTAMPSESPAPSPSPSYQPTITPTVTGQPTATPTGSPTESPAPSPSPSYAPTMLPTGSPSTPPSFQPTTTPFPTGLPSVGPTSFPSVLPSKSPTQSPTKSAMPSSRPSAKPSMLPSSSPSISAAPSFSPSMRPTASSMPSSFPTYVGTQSAFFTAHLALTSKLTAVQQLAFAAGTEDYIQQIQLQGALSLPQVVLNSQFVVDQGYNMSSSGNHTSSISLNTTTSASANSTQSSRGSQPGITMLELHFEVTVIYAGSDATFNLSVTLDPRFQRPDELWIHMLGNYNDVFLPLRPSDTSAIQGSGSSNTSMTSGGLSAILVLAVVAVVLAVAAAIYSVRSHSLSAFGEALESPRGSFDGTVFTDNGLNTIKESFTNNTALVESRTFPNQETDAGNDVWMYAHTNMEDEASRPSLVPDHVLNAFDLELLSQPMADGMMEGSTLKHIPLQRSHGSVDPPTESEVGQSEANYEQYGYSVNPSTSRDRHARLINQVLKSRPGAKSDFTAQATVQGHGQLGATGIYYDGMPSRSYYADDQELMLTKSMGGTLGAAPHLDNSTLASGCCSPADSFFNNILSGKNSKPERSSKPAQTYQPDHSGTLGARPLRQVDHVVVEEQSDFDSLVRRGGLYDVFAPAGPIGIVVDTTKEGPCVHSLKPTSPMLGLINPGDLIVGLDDDDTRGMTAATLTRLMARKSNQKERKITLLAAGGY